MVTILSSHEVGALQPSNFKILKKNVMQLDINRWSYMPYASNTPGIMLLEYSHHVPPQSAPLLLATAYSAMSEAHNLHRSSSATNASFLVAGRTICLHASVLHQPLSQSSQETGRDDDQPTNARPTGAYGHYCPHVHLSVQIRATCNGCWPGKFNGGLMLLKSNLGFKP
ncbi:hypothetical protein FKP32DRAFT_1169161 [Trametes sanguinea]|nr:hypothetical protein FKP32DRAFT_1169161 [Trametes sanguinea]